MWSGHLQGSQGQCSESVAASLNGWGLGRAWHWKHGAAVPPQLMPAPATEGKQVQREGGEQGGRREGGRVERGRRGKRGGRREGRERGEWEGEGIIRGQVEVAQTIAESL